MQWPQDSMRRQSTFDFGPFYFSFWASLPHPWLLKGPFNSIGFPEVIFLPHWLNCNLWNKSIGLQIFHFSFLLRKTYTDSINMLPETMRAWLSEGKDLKGHLVCPFYSRGGQREVKKGHMIWLKLHIFFVLFFSFIFISWRLITLHYCSGFCHTLTWINQRLVHWDDPEGWDGEEGGRGVQDGEHMQVAHFKSCRVLSHLGLPPGKTTSPGQRAGWMNRSIWVRNAKRGFPWWLRGKESVCQCRRPGLDPWSGKIPQATEQLSPCTTIIEPEL